MKPSPSTSTSKKNPRRSIRTPETSEDAPPALKRRAKAKNQNSRPPAPPKPVNAYFAEIDKFRREGIVDNYADIQPFFSGSIDKNCPQLKDEILEAEEMIKAHYTVIRTDYDEMVNLEKKELYHGWRDATEKPNIWRKSLLEKTGGNLRKIKCPAKEKKKGGYEPKTLTWVKPEKDENGQSKKKDTVYVKKLDTGDFSPPMTYWVLVEQNVNTEDNLKLSHMPYFDDEKDDQEMYNTLSQLFPDGIHGFACNWSYINNWLAYKVYRSVLEKYVGEPDVLYYALYRVWPNKFSQREFSQMFPKLCELYAEDGFNWAALEPWKKEDAMEGMAENVQNPTCYACFAFVCPHHGFSKQTSGEFPKGDISTVHLPLPSENDPQKCGPDCWKTIDRQWILNSLTPDAKETAKGEVTIHLEKAKLEQLDIESGAMVAVLYAKDDSSESFCEFVKNNVTECDVTSRVNTCRDVYKLIVNLAESFTDRRLLIRRPSHLLHKSERVQNFRKVLSRPEPRRTPEELAEIAKSTGRSLEDVEEEENKRVARRAIMNPTKQFIACRHLGPCGPNAIECACRENRICSELCQCDINCKQRFPGCNCGPGGCQSNQCQCFFGNWECNPLTCRKCRCDAPDEKNPCKNFPMSRMVQKRMWVAPSKIAGNGLFLLEPVEAGDFITEYVGEWISDDEAERRGAIYDRYHCSYIFNLAAGGAIDSYKVGNLSRFANHEAHNPSMMAKTKVVAGEHRIGFYARRKMDVNDELTFDYGYFGEHRVALRPTHRSPMKKCTRKGTSSN